MQNRFHDDVSGQVVGGFKTCGGLFYKGRQQGGCICANTEQELVSLLKERKDAYVKEYQDIPGLLDDGPEWEIRVF